MGVQSRVASLLATVIVLVLFAVYAFNNRSSLADLSLVSWATLLLVAIGRLMIFFSNGMFVKWTTEAFTDRMTAGEGIYVGILSAVGNFFGPLLGGAGIRAVYLRRVHGLPYTKFTSTLMVYYVILFAINFLLALVGLMSMNAGELSSLLFAVFASGLVALIASAFIRLPGSLRSDNSQRTGWTRRIVQYLVDIEEGWRRLLAMPRLLTRLVGLAILSIIAQFLIAYVSFNAVGANISWAALAVYVSIVTISILVAVTPGAIGVREGMLLVVTETLGVTGGEIIEVAVIDRGVMFALLLVLFAATRNGRVRRALTDVEGSAL